MKRFRRFRTISEAQKDKVKEMASGGYNKNQIAREVNLAPSTIVSLCKKSGWELKRASKKPKRVVGLNVKTKSTQTVDQVLELMSAHEAGYLTKTTLSLTLRNLLER